MRLCSQRTLIGILIALSVCPPGRLTRAEGPIPTVFREQRQVESRQPGEVPYEAIPPGPPLPTVYRRENLPPVLLSLDEAIRITLANADVIRVLAGTTAVASGRTIYDPAIANMGIDIQNARFDPTLNLLNRWNKSENGFSFFDPLDPTQSIIDGTGNGSYNLQASLQKINALGGTTTFTGASNPTYFQNQAVPLNNQDVPTLELNYNQPLLQGGGFAPNLAPIVIARIGTERSFYQMKDAVQESVRSVVEGYWALVVARVDVWVRRRQVEQAEEALRVGEARFRGNINDIAQVAQARSALANFRASLVAVEANLIQREAALRNLLGLPPSDGAEFIPVTDPRRDRYLSDWDALCDLAAEYRPDLIDLQLTLQSDSQQLIVNQNNAQPRVDAFGLYRWKGLRGMQANGQSIDESLGTFDDWSLGLTLSVPLGLRQARAQMRQIELAIARDRANLNQGRHAAVHQLATTTRLIDQTYEQYLAYIEARKAARINLQYQMALFQNGRTIYLNVLQAITDWGNTISSEANALTLYNTNLATLERQTGTILETHGVFFYEEQFSSKGLLGTVGHQRCYPFSLRPDYSNVRYPTSERPADDSFELEKPSSPITRDPLPELDYGDRTPGIDQPATPDFPNLDDSSQDLPGLPEMRRDSLPDLELPGNSLPPVPEPPGGAGARRIREGLDADPIAAAARPQPRRSGYVTPQGNNKLQNPGGSRSPVSQAAAEELAAPRMNIHGRTNTDSYRRVTPAGGITEPLAEHGGAPVETPRKAITAPAKGPYKGEPAPRKKPGLLRLFGK